jgi:transposase
MAWQHRTVAQERAIVGLSGQHTQKEIAQLVGVSAWTVFDVQRKYHIVQRFGRHHVAARRYAYDEHSWGRVLEHLYHELGLTKSEIAERLGVHVDTITRRMRAIGLRERTPSESRRGRPHGKRHDFGWPECRTEGCATQVKPPGVDYCAACRRKHAVA